eukprot:1937118-Pyramimonas_sp.AAC.1
MATVWAQPLTISLHLTVGRDLGRPELLELRASGPWDERRNAARAWARIASVAGHELGEEELVRAWLRVDPRAEQGLRAVGLLEQDDAATPRVLRWSSLLVTAPLPLVAHERPGVPRG